MAGSVAGGGAAGMSGAAVGGTAGASGSVGATSGAGAGGGGGATGGVAGASGAGGASAGGDGGGASGSAGMGGSSGGTNGGSGAYDPCPAPPMPCKIMPSGDSITVGSQSTDTGGYRVPFFKAARADNKSFTFVGPSGAGPDTVDGVPFPENHDGHSGYVIDTIGSRKGLLPLMENNLKQHQPHIVLLMIGTNDINTQLELPQAPARLAKLLDLITTTSPNTLLIVAQIVPTRTDSLNEDVQSYNTAIAGLVSERASAGKHVKLVNMYGAFTANANYKNALLFDGLHPNDAGYAVMAKVWYDALEDVLH